MKLGHQQEGGLLSDSKMIVIRLKEVDVQWQFKSSLHSDEEWNQCRMEHKENLAEHKWFTVDIIDFID